MAKLMSRIAIPVILVGIFSVAIFVALEYDKLDPNFYIILILLTLFVFFFGLATGQSLTSPIKKILDRATELSHGDLSSRVYIETKDELSELAKVFNTIAEELEQNHEQESNTEKSVGIKVKARTEELEETINALEQKVENRTAEMGKLLKEVGALRSQIKNK
jgi:methyl-accepting chemotaxis protein